MTIIKHELKQSTVSLTVWTAAIGFLLAICVLIYPEMKGQMDGVSEIFASMGGFSQAFGMDQVNFGTLTGFYAVECGNILGLGGACFAALCAITVLAKEEKGHTAEFLLAHPVSRIRIVIDKLVSVILQILIMNLVIYGLAVGSIVIVGETVPWKEVTLLHLAYLLLQLELAGICFGISAFLRRGGMGIGLGLAMAMYFLNIIANLTDKVNFLKYITPFGYAEGADIITNLNLDWMLVAIGMLICAAGIVIGCVQYCRKDIA